MNLQSFALLKGNHDYRKPLEFKPIIDKWIGDFRFIQNIGSKFYYLTNYNAPYKRIIALDINYPQEENWREILEGDEDMIIETANFIYGKLLVKYLSDSAHQLKIFELNEKDEKAHFLHQVELPGRGSIEDETSGGPEENFYLFSYQTYTDPATYFRLDLDNYKLETLFDSKFFKEKTDYDPEDYISDHILFKSKDGTDVPLTIIRKKDVLPTLDSAKSDQPILTHLTAYGGFGNSKKPEFSPSNVVFFNNLRGVLAIAHIRGGGEKGLNWQLDGKKENRQNHFDDFIAAAEHLIKIKITDPKHLVISGASNGGVLVATVANQRPDLFALV
jgi:prolyl oligopeptidase